MEHVEEPSHVEEVIHVSEEEVLVIPDKQESQPIIESVENKEQEPNDSHDMNDTHPNDTHLVEPKQVTLPTIKEEVIPEAVEADEADIDEDYYFN